MRSRVVLRGIIAVLPFLLCFLAGCSAIPGSGGEVTGSGTATVKRYDYSGFSSLRVDNAFSTTVNRGDAFSVEVSVDDNLIEYLRVELDGDTLHIGLDPSMT